MKRLQDTPLFDVDVLLELENERINLVDERKQLEKKLKFDSEEELEESITDHLEKFNKVRRKLREENRDIDERPKSELEEEIFQHYDQETSTITDLLFLPSAERFEELHPLLRFHNII